MVPSWCVAAAPDPPRHETRYETGGDGMIPAH
jgi:hypothetical protein